MNRRMHEQNSASVQPYVQAEAPAGVAPTGELNCVCGACWEKGERGWELVSGPTGGAVGVTVGINGLTEAETSATASVMGIVGVAPTEATSSDEPTTDQLLELAGALEQRRALTIVEAVTSLSTGYHDGAFRAGYKTACEEITLRLRTEVWDGCLPPVDARTDGAAVPETDQPKETK